MTQIDSTPHLGLQLLMTPPSEAKDTIVPEIIADLKAEGFDVVMKNMSNMAPKSLDKTLELPSDYSFITQAETPLNERSVHLPNPMQIDFIRLQEETPPPLSLPAPTEQTDIPMEGDQIVMASLEEPQETKNPTNEYTETYIAHTPPTDHNDDVAHKATTEIAVAPAQKAEIQKEAPKIDAAPKEEIPEELVAEKDKTPLSPMMPAPNHPLSMNPTPTRNEDEEPVSRVELTQLDTPKPAIQNHDEMPSIIVAPAPEMPEKNASLAPTHEMIQPPEEEHNHKAAEKNEPFAELLGDNAEGEEHAGTEDEQQQPQLALAAKTSAADDANTKETPVRLAEFREHLLRKADKPLATKEPTRAASTSPVAMPTQETASAQRPEQMQTVEHRDQTTKSERPLPSPNLSSHTQTSAEELQPAKAPLTERTFTSFNLKQDRPVEMKSAEQITVEISRETGKESENMIRVKLHPESLGEVEVRVQQSGKQTSLIFTVDNKDTMALLKQDTEKLAQALKDIQIAPEGGDINFQFEQRDPRGDGMQGGPFRKYQLAEDTSATGGEVADALQHEGPVRSTIAQQHMIYIEA